MTYSVHNILQINFILQIKGPIFSNQAVVPAKVFYWSYHEAINRVGKNHGASTVV